MYPLKSLFVMLILCLCVGCAHKSNPPERLAQEATPPPAAPSSQPPAPAAQGGPSVELVETSYNFGVITDEGEYVHDFKVKNTGTAVLQIKKVLPG